MLSFFRKSNSKHNVGSSSDASAIVVSSAGNHQTTTTTPPAASAHSFSAPVSTKQLEEEMEGMLTIHIETITGLAANRTPFVTGEIGHSGFRTVVASILPASNVYVFNEEAKIWIRTHQRHYKMTIRVNDKDRTIGIGYFDINQTFDYQTRKIAVPIEKHMRGDKLLDKDIEAGSMVAGERLDNGATVNLVVRLIPRDDVLKFFRDVGGSFDTDGDQQINNVEFSAMLAAVGATYSSDEEAKLFAQMDADSSGSITIEELTRFLLSDEFASEPLGTALLHFILDDKNGKERIVTGYFDTVQEGGADGDISTEAGNDGTGAGIAVFNHGVKDKANKRQDFILSVMDRKTGLIVQEFIPAMIKTSIKLLYRYSLGQRLTDMGKVRALLKKMSQVEGAKMDLSLSKHKIPEFINQHHLNTQELLPSEYKNFNEFFFRKLKPDARPIDSIDDASIAVSPADCRMMVFPTIHQATSLWIKGSEFTIPALLGPFAQIAPRFANGSLVIARLAPQDYHRFHFGVTGTIIDSKPIDGTLFTVNPFAVREKEINVYTENKRYVTLMQTEKLGMVAVIAVGATMVGSIIITNKQQNVRKGDEHGYFAFGGSTVVMLFEEHKLQFDTDLLKNSHLPLETLVKMGERIGKVLAPMTKAEDQKFNFFGSQN